MKNITILYISLEYCMFYAYYSLLIKKLFYFNAKHSILIKYDMNISHAWSIHVRHYSVSRQAC